MTFCVLFAFQKQHTASDVTAANESSLFSPPSSSHFYAGWWGQRKCPFSVLYIVPISHGNAQGGYFFSPFCLVCYSNGNSIRSPSQVLSFCSICCYYCMDSTQSVTSKNHYIYYQFHNGYPFLLMRFTCYQK